MKNRFINSIVLSAIGDALGWITEFEKSKESIRKKYLTDKIESFYNWEKRVGGRFNGFIDRIKAGSYSDDTQLLLAVARSIQFDGSLDNNYFSKIELPSWLLYARGAGRTVKNAANMIERKSARWNSNFFTYKVGDVILDYRNSGANGAAMRVLPIALANYKDEDKTKELIFANSIITHGHPRAIAGAILYGIAINYFLKVELKNFRFEDFLSEIGKNIEKKFELPFLNKNEYKLWLIKWNKDFTLKFEEIYASTINEILNYLRDVYRCLKENKEPQFALKLFGCYSPETKGSGVSTVIAGIYFACKYYENPETAIITAVNSIGTDTDSIAAFTGGLIGALYAHSIIPEKWNNVQDREYLEKIAKRLYSISQKDVEEFELIKIKDVEVESKKIESDIFTIGDEFLFSPLGKGTITHIERQKALNSRKYNLIIDVTFEIGQSCRFSKLLDIDQNSVKKMF